MASDAEVQQNLTLDVSDIKGGASTTSVAEVAATPSPVDIKATTIFPTSEQQLNLVVENSKYADKYQETYKDGHLPLPPSKHYLVLTCMDARIDPAAAFGIPLGSAHVIRNAGGLVKDALRSIVISQQLLGTKEIILIKHTGCGMLIFDTPTATGLVKENLGDEAVQELESFGSEFGTFTDLEENVKKDVKFLEETKLVHSDIVISGWIFEVETGKVRRVV